MWQGFIDKYPINNPRLFDAMNRLAKWEMHLNFRNTEKDISNTFPLKEQINKWEQFINKYKTLGDDPKMEKAQKEVAALKQKLNQKTKRDRILKIKSKIAHLEEKDKLDDSNILIPDKIRGWEDIKNSLQGYSDNDAYMDLAEKTKNRLAHLKIDKIWEPPANLENVLNGIWTYYDNLLKRVGEGPFGGMDINRS